MDFFLTCFDVHFISNQLATCILYMREYVCVCAPLAAAGLPMIPCSGAEAELWFCGGCSWLISPFDCRRYLPILRDFPAKFIYDPWNAPDEVQRAAKCVIGVDYPKPMVNHAEASRLNIERMRQIYQQLSRYRGLSKSLAQFTAFTLN